MFANRGAALLPGASLTLLRCGGQQLLYRRITIKAPLRVVARGIEDRIHRAVRLAAFLSLSYCL